jgi:hypothetical protein
VLLTKWSCEMCWVVWKCFHMWLAVSCDMRCHPIGADKLFGVGGSSRQDVSSLSVRMGFCRLTKNGR